MSKYTELENKWNGKYLAILNPGKQCYDVIAQWCRDLGIPNYPGNPTPFPYNNAYQIYSSFGNFQAQYFNLIFNGPNDIPKEGDIVVWSYYYNYTQGHTAVVKSGSLYSFTALSQNDPTGSPCILRTYNYNQVLGWLRPRSYNPTPILTCEQKGTQTKDICNKQGISDTDKLNQIRKVWGV